MISENVTVKQNSLKICPKNGHGTDSFTLHNVWLVDISLQHLLLVSIDIAAFCDIVHSVR